MTTRVVFHKVLQDAKALSSSETHSVSRVFFDLEIDGEMINGLTVDVEEPVGGTHQHNEIMVGKVDHLTDQGAFERAVRDYYRSLVSSAGYGKHLAKDKGFRTFDDQLSMEQVVEL